jgi:phosphopantetheine adenylyltransferase
MAGSNSLVDKITNKLEFSKRGGKTVTGEPANEILVHGASGVNKFVKEEKEKRAVFTFGRFNPPTTGHQKLIDAVKNVAEKQGGEHHIFASQSQDKAKNPLGFDEKVGFMKKMYPKTNVHSSRTVKTVLDAAKHLQARGVTHGTLVVGSDRVDEFHNLLSKYNKNPSDSDYDPKKHFYIPHLSVVSAGQRDPDAEGVEGMSASKMRGHAASGNFKEFSKGVSNPTQAKPMYDTLRNRMGIKEETSLTEILTKSMGASEWIKDFVHSKNSRFAGKSTEERKKMALGAFYSKEEVEEIDERNKVNKQKKDSFITKIGTDSDHRSRTRALKNGRSQSLPADMAGHPYEETIPTPFKRDAAAPGKKLVDIGTDKDLESQDTKSQLPRRKARKLFSAFIEGIEGDSVAGSEKPGIPAPVTTALPSNRLPPKRSLAPLKQKHPIAAVSATEEADYMKSEEKQGLWANIHAKRQRIKAGSGEHMRKPGSKGAPTASGLKSAQEEVEHNNCKTPECCGECDKGQADVRKLTQEEHDYEYEMARNQLATSSRSIERLMGLLKGEGNLEAWVQSKLTTAADYLDTVADYMESDRKSK